MTQHSRDLSRRRLLFGGAASALPPSSPPAPATRPRPPTPRPRPPETGEGTTPGQEGHHRLLRPGRRPRLDRRDHHQRQGAGRGLLDVEFKAVDGRVDSGAQRAALGTLIAQKPDIIVVLPHDGKELNAFGLEAMQAGIPVVNLDRAFPDALAYRLLIKGDNYGMGVSAGQLHRARCSRTRASPTRSSVRSPGMDELELTSERTPASRPPWRPTASRWEPPPAEFTVGQRPAGGVPAAPGAAEDRRHLEPRRRPGHRRARRDQAGQPVREFFMVGGAGSKAAIDAIKADNTVLKATVTYSPSMASSAISLARLIAQGGACAT